MVGHQAVAQHRQTVQLTLLAESFEIESPVFVLQEDILAIIAPLGDVVRYADCNHAGHARHRIVARLFHEPSRRVEFGNCPPRAVFSAWERGVHECESALRRDPLLFPQNDDRIDGAGTTRRQVRCQERGGHDRRGRQSERSPSISGIDPVELRFG
jgi:hypothetical protein